MPPMSPPPWPPAAGFSSLAFSTTIASVVMSSDATEAAIVVGLGVLNLSADLLSPRFDRGHLGAASAIRLPMYSSPLAPLVTTWATPFRTLGPKCRDGCGQDALVDPGRTEKPQHRPAGPA